MATAGCEDLGELANLLSGERHLRGKRWCDADVVRPGHRHKDGMRPSRDVVECHLERGSVHDVWIAHWCWNKCSEVWRRILIEEVVHVIIVEFGRVRGRYKRWTTVLYADLD